MERARAEPDGAIRFQAGPFYFSDMHNEARLDDWDGSYEALRPPNKHPEEWAHR